MTKAYNVTPQLPANGFTALELFCGGGLGGVGFTAAGFDIVKAFDFDKNAIKAYRHNLGDHGELADITTLDIATLPDVDVIFGGPPCQDYSVAGSGAGVEGDRGKLVWSYLDIINAKQPKAFVFENVKGLIGKKHRGTFDDLLERFSEIGYEVSWRLINSWDYEVAQKRERVFIIGVRNDLNLTYEFPQPEAQGYRTQTIRDAIGDLPVPGDFFYFHRTYGRKAVYGLDEPAPTFRTTQREVPPSYPGHHNDAHIIANHSNRHYWTPTSEYTYGQANRVQSFDKPSNTIPAHHNSGQPQHPTEAPRRFTIREALRIQSVPDWYVIPDEIALGAQYRIVGNGIASRVAYVIGVALADQLAKAVAE